MDILNTLKQLRDDIRAWVTNNFIALNAKIDEKTIPIDTELDSASTNPVQNKAIAEEITNIHNKVGATSVASQINTAISSIETFSGDYNDLINAPDIYEDDSGNLVIADDAGNKIFEVTANGVTSTNIAATANMTINGANVATEAYVDAAINEIDIPEPELTNYYTKAETDDLLEDKVSVETGKGLSTNDFTNDYKTKLDEALISFTETDPTVPEWAKEATKPTYTAAEVGLGNVDNTSDADKPVSTATQNAIDALKDELSESIVAETNEWIVCDSSGNIIFRVDATGAHTTALTLQGIPVVTYSAAENGGLYLDPTTHAFSIDTSTIFNLDAGSATELI